MNNTTNPSEQPAANTGELQKRLSRYGVMALAMSGAVAASQQSAHATIIFNGPGLPLTTFVNGTPILFDFGSGTASLSTATPGAGQFRLYAFSHQYPQQNSTFKHGYVRGSYGGQEKIAVDSGTAGLEVLLAHRFLAGDPVSVARFDTGLAQLDFTSHFSGRTYKGGNFPPGSDHQYLGFDFTLNSNQYFGWADISVDTLGDITLNGFAYNNTPGGPIPAGPVVPESSPLLLLLAGGPVAMLAYRQARKRNEASAN